MSDTERTSTDEIERLRALVGDEDQPGWDGCSRAEAIHQANTFHAEMNAWRERHDERRAEREEAREEVARLRRALERGQADLRALADRLAP